jgi:ribosomal protein L13
MLPKGVLGRQYYKRLFIYSDNKINIVKNSTEVIDSNNWIKYDV